MVDGCVGGCALIDRVRDELVCGAIVCADWARQLLARYFSAC
jgi:hypothetical protein